jgi:hypothetical protein
LLLSDIRLPIGGGSGIRTHGADESTTVFKTVTINQTLPSLLFLKRYFIGFVAKCNIFNLTSKLALPYKCRTLFRG